MLTPSKIRQLRLDKKWSQAYLATCVGVNRTTIVRWETGEVKPLPALLRLLEKTLEVEEELGGNNGT